MREYHPIDVRYKGPSTAYRGSAAARKLRETATASKAVPAPKATPRPAPAQPAQTPSPWRGNATAQIRQIVQQATRDAPKPAEIAGGIFSVYRTIRRVYLGFILMVFFYFLLASGFGVFGSLTTQMHTIP